MLPLTLLLPTRNAMRFLPGHLDMMRKWLDLVEEIVVVDSSGDDTLGYLEKELSGPNVRFLQHPPGLYQSWNYGVSQVRSKYVYISTIGDSITRRGLKQLVEVAEERACDVVISPPDLLTEDGRFIEDVKWPVHNIISFLDTREPLHFEGFPLFILAVSFLPLAILGSSASNVYRTETLQKRPFSADFGTMGDCAWGAENAFAVRLGITPLRSSIYVHHAKTYPLSEYKVENIIVKLLEHALAALERASVESPEIRKLADGLDLSNGIRTRVALDQVRAKLLKSRRGGPVPWYVKPGAWRARSSRKTAEKQCLELLGKTSQLNGFGELAARCLDYFFQNKA